MTAADNPVVVALGRLGTALPGDVRWALIGGLAVSARAEPRFTRDVDVAVAVSDDLAAERLAAHLVVHGWTVSAVVEQDEVGRLAQVRLTGPGLGGVVCDLLFASSGIEPEIAATAQALEIVPGLVVPVARTGHLIVLKLLSVDDRRLQDRLDLDALRQVATDADWAAAEVSAALIVQRGFGRGRDLSADVVALRRAT